MKKKTPKDATLEELKAIPLEDEALETVSGGMSTDNAYRDSNTVMYCFTEGQQVYDEVKNMNAYVISRWTSLDSDGYYRAAYTIGGTYDGGCNMSWNAWERDLNAGWRQ